MTETPLWIGTSWKMNKTLAEAVDFAEALAEADADRDPRIQRFVVPPITTAREVKQVLAESSVKVGAQNMHWDDAGAWTGEVSAPMLTDAGLDLVVLGHPERRAHFAETDETVGRKVAAAVRHGLVPLICLGGDEIGPETLARQATGALAPLAETESAGPILLADVPTEAAQMSPEAASDRLGAVAEVAAGLLGRPVPCLYGGVVTSENCAALIQADHVGGLLIGRAARDVAGYLAILAACADTL